MRLNPLLALPLAACGPPDAPDQLAELCGYLYGHLMDPNPRALEAGLDNLDAWLSRPAHLESTLEGYEISNLDATVLEEIEGEVPDLENLHGAAVATRGVDSVWDVAWTLVAVPPEDLSPDLYERYDREFLTDPECFLSLECETLEVANAMSNNYPLGVLVSTSNRGQYRWVDTERGLALVQRTWLTSPAKVNVSWLTVDDQYYLNVVLPDGEASLRLTATWILATLLSSDVPEGVALSLVIDNMQSIYADVDGWLAEHADSGVPPAPEGGRCGCATRPLAGPWLVALVLGWVRRRSAPGRSRRPQQGER
ncbi:MAG: hypothetical protein JXB39_15135 [Deltaproteobacteria bacterium]|nr:hypothetical protein [Deltaproteobacteria bacterium]